MAIEGLQLEGFGDIIEVPEPVSVDGKFEQQTFPKASNGTGLIENLSKICQIAWQCITGAFGKVKFHLLSLKELEPAQEEGHAIHGG